MPAKMLIVTERHHGKRLDIFIAHHEPALSRSSIQKMIKEGLAVVNSGIERPGYRVRLNDRVALEMPEKKTFAVLPEPIPINVIYEDNHIIVLNKPPGLVVHPAPGNYTGTLVNALLYHYGSLPSGTATTDRSESGKERTGIVHRLDKDTSGVLVVARTEQALRSLSAQFKKRAVTKHYLALVAGVMKKGSGEIEMPIGRHVKDRKKISVTSHKAREAVTHFRVKNRYREATLLEVGIQTGRTHQIRVHLAHIGHPVLGDKLYGGAKASRLGNLSIPRQMLHAESLSIHHPDTGHPMAFIAPPPEDMTGILGRLQLR